MIYHPQYPQWLIYHIAFLRKEHADNGYDQVDFPSYLDKEAGIRLLQNTLAIIVDDDTAIAAKLKYGDMWVYSTHCDIQ